jgi:hypothetical protein
MVGVLVAGSACLEPVDEAPLPSLSFDSDGVAAESAPRLEDDPQFAESVATFPDRLPYLRGFAAGERVWYWHVPGPTSRVIVPVFRLERDGAPLGLPIVDVIPGQTGYSPWWRLVRVPVTDAYDDQPMCSRAAIDAALLAGLVEAPIRTERVISAPIVLPSTVVELGEGRTATPTDICYRDHRASWVRFGLEQRLPVDVREIPVRTLFSFQRVNQPFVLNERVADFDLDADGRLVSTNDVFEVGPGDPTYTPAWTEVRVRTSSTYRSFDDGEPEITAAEQIMEQLGRGIQSLEPGQVDVSCPLQAARGEL